MVIVNRHEAIITASHLVKTGDIILIAGKGHEKYQEIKGVRYPFDDKEVLIAFHEKDSAENEDFKKRYRTAAIWTNFDAFVRTFQTLFSKLSK